MAAGIMAIVKLNQKCGLSSRFLASNTVMTAASCRPVALFTGQANIIREPKRDKSKRDISECPLRNAAAAICASNGGAIPSFRTLPS